MKVKLLGIDYGERNVGLSLATTPLAEPLKVVDTEQAIRVVVGLIEKNGIDGLVVGLSEGLTAEKTKAFVRQLGIVSDVPVYFQDETLSTKETDEKLVSGTVKQSDRRKPTDHYVASQILQEFIDENLPLDTLPEAGKITET